MTTPKQDDKHHAVSYCDRRHDPITGKAIGHECRVNSRPRKTHSHVVKAEPSTLSVLAKGLAALGELQKRFKNVRNYTRYEGGDPDRRTNRYLDLPKSEAILTTLLRGLFAVVELRKAEGDSGRSPWADSAAVVSKEAQKLHAAGVRDFDPARHQDLASAAHRAVKAMGVPPQSRHAASAQHLREADHHLRQSQRATGWAKLAQQAFGHAHGEAAKVQKAEALPEGMSKANNPLRTAHRETQARTAATDLSSSSTALRMAWSCVLAESRRTVV